jgi:hypothetical protein
MWMFYIIVLTASGHAADLAPVDGNRTFATLQECKDTLATISERNELGLLCGPAPEGFPLAKKDDK